MFGLLAPKLRDMGWRSLIPIKPREKAPVIPAWETHNQVPPSDRQIEHWAKRYPKHGIGLAYGPDRLIGIDLDFLDPGKAVTARSRMESAFGGTPLLRVGRAPKVMGFYRAYDGLRVEGRAYGGFEIYSRSGQTVIYGIHPNTGQNYFWPDESPETLSPEDLPVVTQQQIVRFISSMESLREDKVIHRGATVRDTGRTATWLKFFSGMPTRAEIIEAGCAGIRGVGPGARHFTMTAVVAACVIRGIPPEEFLDDIEESYSSTLSEKERRKRSGAVVEAANWANMKVWGGRVSIEPVTLKAAW